MQEETFFSKSLKLCGRQRWQGGNGGAVNLHLCAERKLLRVDVIGQERLEYTICLYVVMMMMMMMETHGISMETGKDYVFCDYVHSKKCKVDFSIP